MALPIFKDDNKNFMLMQSSWASQLNPILFSDNYFEKVVSTSTNAGTTSTWLDIASLSLGSGDWDLTGQVVVTLNGATITGQLNLGISTTSGNTAVGLMDADNNMEFLPPIATTASATSLTWRQNISAQTIYYLKLFITYTGGPPTYKCKLFARKFA